MTSFLAELKRRNVVRVAILYTIVGWLVLQIADLVIPALGIPPWGLSLAVVLVALGLPIALVLAWAFEVTPEGIKRTHEVEHHESITYLTGRKLDFVIIGVLAAALLYVALDLFVLRERGVIAPQPRVSPSAASRVSIAVLPFVDMSQAKDQAYLTDGISEELLNALARVEGFKVIGRTSAFAFKGRDEDLPTIGRKLGVENILEGSVRKQGDRIRVSAQLVKAADGYHLWSETYDRQLGDVFAIQDDIARQVVGAIRSRFSASALPQGGTAKLAPPPTDNIEAYTHFLRGQHLLRSRERAGMEVALTEFERAVALDPDFARAHVGIGNSLALLVSYGILDLSDVETRAAAEFERALSIEPGLPEAYAGQALLASQRLWGTTTDHLPLLERAVASNPSDSQSLIWLGQAYAIDGRAADELRTCERAYAVDPLAPVVLVNCATINRRRGHRDRSEQFVNELAALEPDSSALYRLRGELSFDDGHLDESIRWQAAGAKRDPNDASMYRRGVVGCSWLGDLECALSQIARWKEVAPGNPLVVAAGIRVRLEAGDTEAAGKLLQAAGGPYDADPFVQRARAIFLMARGDYAAALEALLVGSPRLGQRSPALGYGPAFFDAPMAAYLFRETGDAAQSRRLAEAFARGADAYYKPDEGVEQGTSLWMRARMAAVTGDGAAVIDNLTRYHEHGGILPAFTPREPWFRAYKEDPAVADLFAKADERREEARRRLRAEGL